MSAEDILSEIPIEELHSVGVVKGLLIMPPSFVQKHILPTIRVRDALTRSGIGEVPGGIETAILFSLFNQSVMDWNKNTGENPAENSAVRAMVNHAKNDTIDHFTLMKEGRNGLYKIRHNCCTEAAWKSHTASKTRQAVGDDRYRCRYSK
jgi:hypothetical protein